MVTPDSIGNETLFHNLALVVLVACPLIAALPPRRLNLGTAGLGISWALSANHLLRERAGRPSLIQQAAGIETRPSNGSNPEIEKAFVAGAHTADETGESKEPLIRWPANTDTDRQSQSKRAEEHRKKLEEGLGYGDIIKEQVWEVWNQDKSNKD